MANADKYGLKFSKTYWKLRKDPEVYKYLAAGFYEKGEKVSYQLFGKLASAFTSSICCVCLLLWAEISRIN